jgi:protein HIRA/HIR1
VLTSNICSVVALGADDRSVSIWQTKSARPLIVAKEVFERQIMDLNWCARRPMSLATITCSTVDGG